MTSSSQSVAGQPVAAPDSIPAHHGLSTLPPSLMVWVSVISSAQVVGTVQPFSLNIVGEYQTSDLKFVLFGAA